MAPVDTKALKDEALDSLLATLDAIRGRKCLVIDRSLASTLSLIASYGTLQEHGVEKMFWLDSPSLVQLISAAVTSSTSGPKYITFLVPSVASPHSAALVASTAQQLLNQSNSTDGSSTSPYYDISVIQTPDRAPDLVAVLENAGVLGDISLHIWPIYFVPLAPDLLSLNMPGGGGFRDACLANVPSTVHHAAAAIQDIQQRYGLVGRITGKGRGAQELVDILLRKREEHQTNLSEAVSRQTGPPPSVNDIFDHQYTNIFSGKNIEQLVVIDRQIDPLTPLLTQLTYQGLIEEFYGVTESGQVELPIHIVTPPQNKDSPQAHQNSSPLVLTSDSAEQHPDLVQNLTVDSKKVTLGSDNDQLFATIKDTNFSTVGHTLNKVARQLQSDYELRHEAKTVNQIKAFVGKLGGLQSLHQVLRFHTALAEELMTTLREEEFNKWLEIQQNLVADTLDLTQIHTMIEDLIDRASNPAMVLRLLCIDSVCNGGIKEKELLHFKREFLQTYGYQHLTTFENLETLGLLFPRHPSKPNWFPSARKQLALISEQQDDMDPSDIAFTYSGYSPLSVRIVQAAIDKDALFFGTKAKRGAPTAAAPWKAVGWKGAEAILKNIPGPRVDEVQHDELFLREGKLRKILTRNSPTPPGSGPHKANIIVFYIGGITYAEIAALRFISERSDVFNILIATTGLISGDKIIDAASP
ncbi:uncharacterized protein SAPINGB_P003809 [Magnusiomyces paraingens]|uniref:Sec1-like protein n=1 Tax=Magnusiomyces paraingens TaxID=2606893 RepID=A0A5E8BYP4_9ASCO|nr:uncharacterized protein SAPINGB_P003809 [Saprochaete ingens]VVT53905.1 unnamed protein product [Saprochaete ingens]